MQIPGSLKVAKFAPCRKTRFKMTHWSSLNSRQRVWSPGGHAPTLIGRILIAYLIVLTPTHAHSISSSTASSVISLPSSASLSSSLSSSSSSSSSSLSSSPSQPLVSHVDNSISNHISDPVDDLVSLSDSLKRPEEYSLASANSISGAGSEVVPATVCDICWCNRDEELDCRHRDDVKSTIEAIPQFPSEKERDRIVEITASNQPRLIHLDSAQFRNYTNLEKLIIEHSALKTIDYDAFRHNRQLTEISLKNNQLRSLSWRHFDGLHLLDLSIENNPLRCDCPTAKWIQHLVNQKRNILGPYWANITCTYNDLPLTRQYRHSLANLTVSGCEYPTVQISPSKIAVNESQPIILTCTAEGSPKPEIYWNTSTLNSDYRIVNSESEQVIFMNRHSEPVYRVSQILRIEIAQIDDNEEITCWAENDVGKANDSVVITVYSAPRIELMELEHKFYDCINFRVKGIPYANITWYKNDRPLVMKDGNYKEYRIKEHGAWINGYLEIQKESAGIMGLYTLVAENTFGRDNRSMYLNYKQGIIATGDAPLGFPGTGNSTPVEQPPIPPNSFVPPPILSQNENPPSDKNDQYNRLISQNRIDPNNTREPGAIKSTLSTTGTFFAFSGVFIILICVLLLISFVVQRHQSSNKPNNRLPDSKTGNGNLNRSWDSNIDNNHNRRQNIAPIRAIAAMFNWINRKKRLLDARRETRHRTRNRDNSKQRATALYQNNGRIQVENSFGSSSQDGHFSPMTETDPAMIALLKSPTAPIGLVSNPNYMSETSHLDLENVRHIASEKISFIKELGEGAFGRVSLGTVDYLDPDEPTTLVAIKILKEQGSLELRKEFTNEARLLANLVHKNIVTFFGISMDDTAMMIFEYMEYGDLNKFLRERDPFSNAYSPKRLQANASFGSQESSLSGQSYITADRERWRTLNFEDLIHIATQIACGMEYLAKQRFVHRDLATRNCLVGMNLVTKIGDFGMSRDVYATDYYRVGRDVLLPIRWMSPESILYRKYTTESDCWSFGILLWEILTYGKQPWFEYTNTEVIKHVTQGRHLVPPEECPKEIVELMQSCWEFLPSDRETMIGIHARFVKLEHDIQEGLIKVPEQMALPLASLSPPAAKRSASAQNSADIQPAGSCFVGASNESAAADFCRSQCAREPEMDSSESTSGPAVYLELSHA